MSPAAPVRAQLLQIVAVLELHPALDVIGTITGAVGASVQARTIDPLIVAYPDLPVRPRMTVHGMFRHIEIDGVDCYDLRTFTAAELVALMAPRVEGVAS